MGKFIALYLLLAGIFLGHYAVAGQAVYGDGIDYWVYLHSWYFDKDLDFTNEYKHNYSAKYNNGFPEYESEVVVKTDITLTGKTNNFHPPGVAIILFPAYVAADITAAAINFLGGEILRNGYSDIYQIFSGLWAVSVGILGVKLGAVLAGKLTEDKQSSEMAAIIIFLASPLLYYGSYDVLNSHFASFAVSALFWLVLFYCRRWLYIGIVVGLAGLIRLQDLLLGLLSLQIGVIIISGIVMLPEVSRWWELYGKLYPETYLHNWIVGSGMWGSWFHATNGLFWRTPILFLALAALPKATKTIGKKMWLMLAYFAAQTALIAIQGGWSAAAYGGRLYISTLPMFIVLLTFIVKKLPKTLIWGLVILNFVSIASFVLFEKEVNSGQKRGLEEHTTVKVESLLRRVGLIW